LTNSSKEINRSMSVRFATVFGLGRVKKAPGTAATLFAGIPCVLAVGSFSWHVQLVFAGVLFGAGWYVSEKAERLLGREDPGEIVIDEVCGYLVAMIGRPMSFLSILTGFLLFRVFDIWKPWPIRFFEKKLTGGVSIMVDDVLAGIIANLLGYVISDLLGAGT
jgi:phosphatidylglycerophosphatase A